ncbi:MAG: hypothetical protein KGY57_06540 [Gammaproteobacteria bacterium]|nr:hypothetical protein [Gammaproteobacteria bacterium]
MGDHLGAPLEAVGFKHGSAGSIQTGCRVDCWLQFAGDGELEVRFEVFAECPTIEAAAWLADWLTGRDIDEAKSVTGLWLAEVTKMPAERRGDALCIEDALRLALGES